MPETIRWARSWDAAVKEARATKKLILIDFWADWCGFCHKLDRETFVDPTVIRSVNRFVAIRLNSEKEGVEQAQKFRVSSLPTILLLKHTLEPVGTIRGFMPAGPFAEKVESILKASNDFPRLVARVKSNPKDLTAAKQLVDLSLQQGQSDTAMLAAGVFEQAKPGQLGFERYFSLGQVLARNERIDAAQRYFVLAASKAGTGEQKAASTFFLGVTHFQQKHFAQARQCLETALKTPGCPESIRSRAQMGLRDIPKK